MIVHKKTNKTTPTTSLFAKKRKNLSITNENDPQTLNNNIMKYQKPQSIEPQSITPHKFVLQLQEEIQQLSQIKFISKQLSSIKNTTNDLDCINEVLEDMSLDGFSSSFDDERRKSDIQIMSICQSRMGCIRKNRKEDLVRIQTEEEQLRTFRLKQKDMYIHQIFKSLDKQNKDVLSKDNCETPNLTTELSYIIGSLLNKIRHKEIVYYFDQFSKEFKQMIKEINEQQLTEIIQKNKNRYKKLKKLQKQESSIYYNTQRIEVLPLSPCFKDTKQNQKKCEVKQQAPFTQRLNRISSKINSFLDKRKIVPKKVESITNEFRKMDKSDDILEIHGIQETFILNFSQLNKHL